MKKLKIITIVGTRPEIIRLSRVVTKLDLYMEHIMVHTGQNYDYELNEIFYRDLEIRQPDYFLNANGNSATETISNIIASVDKLLDKENPDAVLVLGDTNSCLSTIPAKRKKIPIFHMEAGNRCFDYRVPEEINRKIVDHISDLNMPYSNISRENLIREGFPTDQIVKTGSPMYEVLKFYESKIYSSEILEVLDLKPNQYFLISSHREENIDNPSNLAKLLSTIENLYNKFKLPIVISTHPRTRQKIEKLNKKTNPEILFHKPFSFTDYNFLQLNSKVVLSDSGTINEESSILNFRALNIRDAFERQEAMEEASVMMVGLDWKEIESALLILESQPNGENRLLKLVEDYSIDNVSDKVVRIIQSYIHFINKKVWKK